MSSAKKPAKPVKLTDSPREFLIEVIEIAIFLLGVIPFVYMLAMANNKVMSLIVPKEMGYTLTLPYAYIYLLILVIQTTVLKEIMGEYIKNPNVNAAIMTIVGGYQAAFTLYGKKINDPFIVKSI